VIIQGYVHVKKNKMKKFNYIKWKSSILPGLLTEQATGSATGSYITCYGCEQGQIISNSSTFTGSYDPSNGIVFGYCGSTNPTPNTMTAWYDSSTNAQLSNCINASGSAGTGSGCVVNQQAQNSTTTNPQLGDAGINQNFVNNMQGKPTQFYSARMNAFGAKLQQLRANDYNPNSFGGNGGYEGFCQGSNPHWQSKLVNKMTYVQNCMQNPGSC